ncbi:hypothetical protein FAI40_00765 [Acetobacteraceae bacterium]|nr:hypothetical protein FAI40_00765 [Acetobacteraceae bacterium]
MFTKFILMPAILLTHITGGEVATVYDLPGPHWFNSSSSCEAVAEVGNQNLRSGRGQALRIVSVQSYFACHSVSLDDSDRENVQKAQPKSANLTLK